MSENGYDITETQEAQTVYIAQIMPQNPSNPAKIYVERLGTTKDVAKQRALESVDEYDFVPYGTLHNLDWSEDHVETDGVIFNIQEKTLYKEA